MNNYIDADKLVAEIERRLKDYWELSFHDSEFFNQDSNVKELKELLSIIHTLKQEQSDTSYCKEHCKGYKETGGKCFFDWQCPAKTKAENQKKEKNDFAWHSVNESLPPMDDEVIVLTDSIYGKIVPDSHRVCYGHIVDKNVAVDYDGWNIPGVTHWMRCPKIPE